MIRRVLSVTSAFVLCSMVAVAQTPRPLNKKDPGYLSAATLGAPWPLTVPEVIVTCRYPELLVMRVPTGTEYALNGSAKSRLKLPSPEPVWKFRTDVPGNVLRISIAPLLDAARKRCG